MHSFEFEELSKEYSSYKANVKDEFKKLQESFIKHEQEMRVRQREQIKKAESDYKTMTDKLIQENESIK